MTVMIRRTHIRHWLVSYIIGGMRTMDNLNHSVECVSNAFRGSVTRPVQWRKDQLRALRSMILDNKQAFEEALYSDLGKSPIETQLTELGILVAEIDRTLSHIDRWTRPRKVGIPWKIAPANGYVVREPLGVVLIIAPWNYPIQLLLGPLIGALAAGNAVVLKPSELAPACSHILDELLTRYLDRRAVRVVQGGVEETGKLLDVDFDHIFFTGSGAVGRLVLAAAARKLTPVTLELGGKSPAWVDDTVDLNVAARRIVWGKFTNAGQTCIAPDYILTTPETARRMEVALSTAIVELYGDNPEDSEDYGRIVSDRHYLRLCSFLDDGRVVIGGTFRPESRYIAPTVLADVDAGSSVMAEEIFGPILPIVTVGSLDEGIDFVNDRDKPLALYVFSESRTTKKRFESETSSGAIGFGAPLLHPSVPDLPFGGVGASGMGSYHGERSLTTFSHEKAVLHKPTRPDTLGLIQPPYSSLVRKIVQFVAFR